MDLNDSSGRFWRPTPPEPFLLLDYNVSPRIDDDFSQRFRGTFPPNAATRGRHAEVSPCPALVPSEMTGKIDSHPPRPSQPVTNTAALVSRKTPA